VDEKPSPNRTHQRPTLVMESHLHIFYSTISPMAGTSLVILYGSETGTSEDLAFKIYTILCTSIPHLRIFSLDDYSIENLPSENCTVFVVSTTGDGEVPSSMKSFWNFLLRKSLPSDSLVNLKYGIFGLGDSGYDKFNAAAR
jgi:sulfite reductase alpha subunit-like flavoprotein